MTAALAAGIAVLPSAAQAADDCVNAAVRAQQQSQHLPNCMAYEQVTPDDKGGETPGAIQITEDGSGLTFMLNAGIVDAPNFVAARYRAQRSADGRWTTNALMPPMEGRLPSISDAMGSPHAVTPDLSRMVASVGYGVHPNDQGWANQNAGVATKDLYLREADGSFRWLVPDPSVVDTSTVNVSFVGASADLDRVVMGTSRPWDARVEATPGVEQLYAWTPSGTHLVSVLPNGDPAPTLPNGSPNDGTTDGYAVSADARRVAFATGNKLYVRFDVDDPATAVTREVGLGPNGEQCESPSVKALSADGSQLAFDCFSAILPGGPSSGLYVRDLDGGASAIRRVGDTGGAIVGNDDFSRLYVAGAGNGGGAFVVRDGGAPESIATPVSGTQIDAPEISDDGEYVAFASSSDFGLPGVNRVQPNGKQLYRYSVRSGDLTCISCRPSGAPTDGVASFRLGDLGAAEGGGGATQSGMRPVSTDGTVTFTSTSALVPEDTNGIADVYAWVDDRAVLLSGGREPLASAAQGASSDGSSLFFRTTASLVPEDRDGGTYDIYAVRTNGGRPAGDAAPAPCSANCQGPGPQVPGLPNVGSPSFAGRGNLIEEATSAPKSKATASLTVAARVTGTSTAVRVKVSRAGSIRVSGVGLRATTVTAKKAGTYRVTVRLSAHGTKQQRAKGRIATRVTARFSPSSGAPVTARKAVTFTARKGGR